MKNNNRLLWLLSIMAVFVAVIGVEAAHAAVSGSDAVLVKLETDGGTKIAYPALKILLIAAGAIALIGGLAWLVIPNGSKVGGGLLMIGGVLLGSWGVSTWDTATANIATMIVPSSYIQATSLAHTSFTTGEFAPPYSLSGAGK